MEKAARIIEEEKTAIMDQWEAAVKEKVPASGHTTSLALRDHLPQLLEDVVRIMRGHSDSETISDQERYQGILGHSIEHGRHRASTSFYTIDQILQEFIILHQILTVILIEKEAFNSQVGAALKFSIENSMLYSATAFNEALQDMRQKLIGILAHDMRNPISAAIFAVDIMDYDQGKEKFQKLKSMTRNSLKRTVDLIEGLLDSVTVGAGEGMTLDFAEGNIMENVQSVYEEASVVYANRIELKNGKERITGIFDGTMIRRMLENLISNAVKYGSRDGTVSLEVEDQPKMLLLKVHNWGNPIPEESQKRIFHFLNSTHSNGVRELKSWGMGLTLVRAVAEAHGGNLEVKSNLEEGTTFSVRLDKFSNSPGKKRAALNFR